MTVRAKFQFVVKANVDRSLWIAFEPLHSQLRGEGLPSGLFGFDLPAGTSKEKAETIARYLDENIEALNFTQMPLA